MKNSKLEALQKVQAQATSHKPRTTPLKPSANPEATEGKRITSYLHTDEVEAIQRIQALCLRAGRKAPSVSQVLGAAIRELVEHSDGDILHAIERRPDRRK